jgi:rod shape determining protein RodA
MASKIYVEKKFFDYLDYKLLLPVLLLTIIGLISIYSSTSTSASNKEFQNQIMSFGIGLISLTFFTLFPEKLMRYIVVPIYSLAILSLLVALVFGTINYGTKGWISIGGKSFQPAELAKFAVILTSGFIFTNLNVSIKYLRTFMLVIGLYILPVVLILLQPDFGTSVVFFAILIGLLYWTGIDALFLFTITFSPVLIILSLTGNIAFWLGIIGFAVAVMFFRNKLSRKIIVIGLSVIISVSAPMIYSHLAVHQQARINTFLSPGKNLKDTGYNVAQSVLAVGSGGLEGKGFMHGTQTQLRYIPMQWTDFIYSVPAEEFGFIGATIVLILFFLVLKRILDISVRTRSRFFSVICISTASLFLFHIFINVGMVLGITPVMGIPLPFMSYGGTSLIVNYSLIGLILNAYRTI